VYFTRVCDQILPRGYAHASGDGAYSVSKRHLYYAVREQFKETGRSLEWKYFADTLLVQDVNRHRRETAGWKLTADPRGFLDVPNAAHEVSIPVGTLRIDAHLKKAARHTGPYDDLQDVKVPVQWPSLAAGQRYQGVLYIEKEGFAPMLEEARIAERFDLAVISCKGQSVVATRRFVDRVCAKVWGVPLFVVHDFDKAGFEISQRLTRVSEWAREHDRVTYEFQNDIEVVDLGLRLADVEEYGLDGKAEQCKFKGGFASDSIATAEEREFLRSNRRVELDALTAPEFIEWLEAKLEEHLPDRLIPDDGVLADAYRRAVAVAKINRAIEDVRAAAVEEARSLEVPKNLRRQLEKAMEDSEEAWDQTLYELVAKKR
jgi:hypothetical protein